MQHPVDFALFPEAARKALAGPPPMKMMVARGMAPLPPPALVCALYGFAYSTDDANIKAAAEKTLAALPDAVLNGALAAADLPPAVLDDLAVRLSGNRPALERIMRHTSTPGETVVAIARRCDEAMAEIIAINEARLLQFPAIIEALYLNEKTRMSTADRIVEFAARNGLQINLPNFEDIVAALTEQKPNAPPPPAVAAQADEHFRTALEEAKAISDHEIAEDEAGELKLGEKAEKADKAISKMTITEKIRTAMLGNAAQRSLLIRSPNRLVFAAVLNSPKLQDDEVVKFSASRQIGADVLRRIAGTRTFTRLYDVKLNLVTNPKTPLVESMKFLSHLREVDLKKLLGNKNISSGLRNAANGLTSKKNKLSRATACHIHRGNTRPCITPRHPQVTRRRQRKTVVISVPCHGIATRRKTKRTIAHRFVGATRHRCT
jgi:hypothetical protein